MRIVRIYSSSLVRFTTHFMSLHVDERLNYVERLNVILDRKMKTLPKKVVGLLKGLQ